MNNGPCRVKKTPWAPRTWRCTELLCSAFTTCVIHFITCHHFLHSVRASMYSVAASIIAAADVATRVVVILEHRIIDRVAVAVERKGGCFGVARCGGKVEKIRYSLGKKKRFGACVLLSNSSCKLPLSAHSPYPFFV
jgi:hypothetical protein